MCAYVYIHYLLLITSIDLNRNFARSMINFHRKYIIFDECQHLTFSVSNCFLRLMSITPVLLNKDSDATKLGGEVAKIEYCC